MKTKGQFILFTVEEFDHWLSNTQFSRTIARIQNHHTWKPNYADFNGSNHFARLEAMRDYHMNHNGWNDIGQNLTTFPDGTVAICRSFEATPACILGVNSRAICIENLGDFDDGRDEMNKAHKSCIVRVNALLCREFSLTPNTETIVYHHWYDLDTGERNDGTHNNKSCPGTNFFGGNKVEDCEANFLPLVRAVLEGREVAWGAKKAKGPRKIAPLRRAVVQSPDGILNVRTGPKAGATKVDELANGTVISIFEISGGWYRIDPEQSRWVSREFLIAAPKRGTRRGKKGKGAGKIAPLRSALVQSPDGILNVRTGPNASATEADRLANGTVVSIFEISGDWCRIHPAQSLWVASRFLIAAAEPDIRRRDKEKRGPGELKFDLPKPKASELAKGIQLWGTYYYGQAARQLAGGIPLRNMKGEVVGPPISQRDWCLGAMEGTVIVEDASGKVVTFNYEDKGPTAETSCKAFFPNLNPAILAGTERVRWRQAKGPFGDGAGGFILSPYRTLAVDKNLIPLGTPIYIPEARGVTVILPNGGTAKHDGYFFGADVGGAIKGNHVDFFLGPTSKNPFPFVKSKPQNTFVAHRALNASVRARLTKMHTA